MYKDTLRPGFMYHLYNRGNNKENLFKEVKNYQYLLNLWKRHIQPVADTFCYSLQPNHFHFLVQLKESLLSKKIDQAFSNCFNAYAKGINKAYHRVGSLFQERFGRKMIENEKYYTQIIWYIHSNAQKHGIAADFRQYPYSSYKGLLSNQTTLLRRNEVLDWFGGRQPFIRFHEKNQVLLVPYLNKLSTRDL